MQKFTRILYIISFTFLSIIGFSQTNYGPGHLIGKTYKYVENKFKDGKYYNFKIKESDKLRQTYITKDNKIQNIYYFAKQKNHKYCYKTTLITNRILGEKLINNHIYYKMDWEKLTDSTYLYNSKCNCLPVIVEVKYCDTEIILNYKLNDERGFK